MEYGIHSPKFPDFFLRIFRRGSLFFSKDFPGKLGNFFPRGDEDESSRHPPLFCFFPAAKKLVFFPAKTQMFTTVASGGWGALPPRPPCGLCLSCHQVLTRMPLWHVKKGCRWKERSRNPFFAFNPAADEGRITGYRRDEPWTPDTPI